MTKAEVLQLAGDTFKWSKEKVLSWYKLENPHLNGASPKELVERGETRAILELLEKRKTKV